jgi:hypothetical protein
MVSFYFNVNWLIYTYCCTLLDAISADLTWQEMDHISDSNLELYQYSDSDSDSNSDSDPDCHPILEPVSIVENPLLEADSADSDTFTPGAADLPEVIQLLWKQLLSNYTPPNHPPIIDPRGCPLTEVEVLSLKHYLAWVDSRGTVKAYGLHAKVLEEVGNVELLTLYNVMLVERQSDLDKKVWMQLVGDSAMILGH